MSDVNLSPNMAMPVPIPSQAPGPDWAQDYNSCLSILDQHTHAAGSGVQISQDGIMLTAANTTFDSLSFNTSNAFALRSVRYTAQSAALALATDIGCTYVAGVDLYYNDVNGNQIKLTSGGVVNATSSGISSGNNTASFVANVLVVNRAALTPANIQCASILLGNNVASSNYLTLQPPNAMGASYSLTLPTIPGATSFVSLDASGNFAGYAAIAGGITGSNIAAATIAGANIAATTIAASNIVNATITGTQIASNINLAGKTVQANSQNIVTANTNATTGLSIIRGIAGSGGTVVGGEGWTISGTTTYTITFSTAFADTPAVVAFATTSTLLGQVSAASTTACTISFRSTGGVLTATNFHFIAIGAKA